MNYDVELEAEIYSLKQKLELHASTYGMNLAQFCENMDTVDQSTLKAVIPLLERRIDLLKLLWHERTRKDYPNVFLFTRTPRAKNA